MECHPRPNRTRANQIRAGRSVPSGTSPVRIRRRQRTSRNSVPITYTSGEQVEVYRFSVPATILIPLIALFLQAWLPLGLHFFSIFDLPLLVTIAFAMARRGQISGLLTGAVIGLLQDSLTHHPIGVFGIAKTVVGYGASSLGVKLDVENVGTRFLVTLLFYVVHETVYFMVARGLVGLTLEWSWGHELGSAFANAILAAIIFTLLDRFKLRA